MLRTLTQGAVGLLAGALLLAPAAPAVAKEESKIKMSFENTSSSSAPRARGWARLKLDDEDTRLHLKVMRLAADTEYLLTFNGVEFDRFTTSRKGTANVFFDVVADGTGMGPMDPRGKLVAVNDGVEDVLAGVMSGPLEPRRILVKEVTDLEPEMGVVGTAGAAFRRTPNGKMRFWLKLTGVTPGDYDVLLDGAPFGTISTNSGGEGKLQLRDMNGKGGGKGKGKARHKWGDLTEDPRGRLLEVEQGGVVAFSGPMLAQIDGLNVCTPDLVEVALTGTTGAGTVRYGIGDDCDDVVEVEVEMLAAGDYDLQVNGTSVGTLSVGVDGTGALEFESSPETGEQLLDFTLQTGDVVDVVDPVAMTAVLSATLP